ncbi:uncharacterized protein ARMOST_20380 [Armillaria ostoyae]|uniref:Uncharacterized protein n=1 Tax=Armillaria ostoyae TaxID=47428 RepID=A0A284S775_ARMOS|nr:uncharacterized protein ARMOST_20380 [Armillaria ostoyae]
MARLFSEPPYVFRSLRVYGIVLFITSSSVLATTGDGFEIRLAVQGYLKLTMTASSYCSARTNVNSVIHCLQNAVLNGRSLRKVTSPECVSHVGFPFQAQYSRLPRNCLRRTRYFGIFQINDRAAADKFGDVERRVSTR